MSNFTGPVHARQPGGEIPVSSLLRRPSIQHLWEFNLARFCFPELPALPGSRELPLDCHDIALHFGLGCGVLRNCRQSFHPVINLRRESEHGTALGASWPAYRQRKLGFPPLHRSYAGRKIVCNFFPAMQNSVVVGLTVRHAHTVIIPFELLCLAETAVPAT